MAKKRETPKVQAVAEPVVTRHARIELPDDDYQRLKRAADRRGLAVAAYIRQAVLLSIEADEAKGGGR